ncbi:MAG: NAD(P)-binding domain-containing protein, partial [Oceanisphaera sp.]|nr:NAD(P)-binding domain-containing protein [Oceanisphaera sp.]
MATIAFIGLGNMGSPMVVNLLKAGHRVQVFDLQPAAVQAAAEKGAVPAGSAVEAVQQAQVVITMLQSGTQVDSLYVNGPNPLFEHLA